MHTSGLSGETTSRRPSLKEKRAHCLEGAGICGRRIWPTMARGPLLMDFQTAYDDEDHVIALFRENGCWGAISKTNHFLFSDFVTEFIKRRANLRMYMRTNISCWDGRNHCARIQTFLTFQNILRKNGSRRGRPQLAPEALDKSPHFPIFAQNEDEDAPVSRSKLKNMRSVEWEKRRQK